MATILTIKSAVNGLEQEVTQQQYDTLVAHGYKGKIISTKDTSKAAKEPVEVTETKKK